MSSDAGGRLEVKGMTGHPPSQRRTALKGGSKTLSDQNLHNDLRRLRNGTRWDVSYY